MFDLETKLARIRGSLELLDILKGCLDIQRDKDLAEKLGIKPGVLAQWRHFKRVNHTLILELAIKEELDLNYLFDCVKGFYPDRYQTYLSRTKEDRDTGEYRDIYKIVEGSQFKNTSIPYDPNSQITLKIPGYKKHLWDRYWVVPDERMAPYYQPGDILVLQYQVEKPDDGELVVLGIGIKDKLVEEGRSLYLGYFYDITSRDGRYYSIQYRLASTNQNYRELFFREKTYFFKILYTIRNNQISSNAS